MDDYKASEASYELSEVSINDLKQLALEIRTGTQPLVLIHAYCFSKYNVVNQILTKYGAMVRISLSTYFDWKEWSCNSKERILHNDI